MSKNMRLIYVVLISAMLPLSGAAYATVATSGVDLPTVPTPPVTTPTVTSPTTTGPTFPMATPAPAPVPSINPAAAQGQASQNGGAGANNAAGAALIAAGAALMANPPTVPAGAALMAMGLLALAQGSHDSNAAGQSAATYAASVNAGNPAFGNGTTAYTSPQAATAQAALANAGYSMTPTGLTTPDGSTIPNSAFNSSEGMANAGMSPNQIAAVRRALADVNGNAPKVSSTAMSEGAGGYSPKAASSSSGSAIHFANPFNLNSADKKQIIAGKTVLFDGDPIGVRGQNIFEMVHERYQKRRLTNDFIENENGADVRAPASVAKPTFVKAK